MSEIDADKIRCFGNGAGHEILATYHDSEWGVPAYNDRLLFEMLTLEGAQAGLNWEIVLKKRAGYKNAFYNFDLQKVIGMSDAELESLRENKDINRNRLKIYSVHKNAAIIGKTAILNNGVTQRITANIAEIKPRIISAFFILLMF